jgi:hypothetical protein
MSQLSQGARGEAVPQHRATGLDLILQARAMRYRWFASALTRLSAKLDRLGAQLFAQPDRLRTAAVAGRLRQAQRPTT